MPVEVILPKVDMDMSHGTLATWHVTEGEVVAKGAALFDIETDKAAMEVEAPASGRLQGITARPGDRVAVGTVVALIYAEGEALTSGNPVPPSAPTTASGHAPGPVPSAPTASDALPSGASLASAGSAPRSQTVEATAQVAAPDPAALRATPAARAAARDAGVALADVRGTGPQGRIQRDDVGALARGPAATPHWTPEPGPLHVSHRKGTGVPLILLHGLTADSQAWAPLERALPPERALIRIDLPGHGRSPRRRIASFAELARMVTEAFDDATPERAHLLGHSLGGALALALADIRPRRVASLSLIAPAGLGPEVDAAALTGITRASRTESLAPWLRRLTATPDGITDDYARAAMRLRTDPALRAAQSDMAAVLFADGTQTFDLRPALSRLTAPTTLIWGRQDHILPHAHALAADGEVAIHLLSGAGHIPQIECPDRVARIILRHLAGAEAPQ